MRQNAASNKMAAAALQTTTSKLRQVLHVQSISYWAPVCVGPYSQVNTLRSAIHLLAGQIGLVPSTMKLRDTWQEQLEQCWTNSARVLDALDGSALHSLLSCLVYVGKDIEDWGRIEHICREQILGNGGVMAGAIDSTATLDSIYDGYEDEETWREMTKAERVPPEQELPLLLVSIPEMPVGALVEIEVQCPTKRAISCFPLQTQITSLESAKATNRRQKSRNSTWGLDTGTNDGAALARNVRVDAITRSMGKESVAMCTLAAVVPVGTKLVDLDTTLEAMLASCRRSIQPTLLSVDSIVNLRLYYLATGKYKRDGVLLRSSLARMLAEECASYGMPSSSVIPVGRMRLVHSNFQLEHERTIMAMQVLVMDPVHFETELWIHHGREYN